MLGFFRRTALKEACRDNAGGVPRLRIAADDEVEEAPVVSLVARSPLIPLLLGRLLKPISSLLRSMCGDNEPCFMRPIGGGGDDNDDDGTDACANSAAKPTPLLVTNSSSFDMVES